MARVGDGGRGQGGGARPLADYASGIVEPVVARRAGMDLALLAAWPEIVGAPHDSYTRPERIKWPRRAGDDDPFEPGTLFVACDGARAVLFMHETDACLARVNTYFGFRAVARIRLVQKPVRNRAAPALRQPPEPAPEARARLDAIVSRIEDEGLRARLERLGRGVFAARRGS